MSSFNSLVQKLNECVQLIDEVQLEITHKYDSSGFQLYGINDKVFLLIKSQLQHLIVMLDELDLN